MRDLHNCLVQFCIIIILVALLCSFLFFLSPPFASLVFYGAGHYFCTMSIQYFYNFVTKKKKNSLVKCYEL